VRTHDSRRVEIWPPDPERVVGARTNPARTLKIPTTAHRVTRVAAVPRTAGRFGLTLASLTRRGPINAWSLCGGCVADDITGPSRRPARRRTLSTTLPPPDGSCSSSIVMAAVSGVSVLSVPAPRPAVLVASGCLQLQPDSRSPTLVDSAKHPVRQPWKVTAAQT
jgi:hypothetical protein